MDRKRTFDLWRTLTIHWPCALGDWLWAKLVVAPAAWLDRLTFKSVLKFGLRAGFFAMFLLFFQQIMAFDLSFLFYIDVAAYPEIAATLFVLVAAGFAGRVLAGAARFLKSVVQSGPKMLFRFANRQRRTRSMRKKDARGSKTSDDESAAAWCAGPCIPSWC